MSTLNKAIAEYTKEWDELLTKFSLDRKLPFDLDQWPDSDLEEWETLSEEVSAKLRKAIADLNDTPLDEREDDDFYMIDITVDTEDGPEYETIDVRKITLEHLKDICSIFPKYNNYYFTKVANSL
jgi:hypothetical protein